MVGHDETEHVLWLCSVEDSDFFQARFEEIPCTYIADGHHRAASAFNVGKLRRAKAAEEGSEISGEEPFNFFMAIHYPQSNLKIMDYNRVLKSLNELSSADFLQQVCESYDLLNGGEPLTEGESPKPAQKGECSLYLDNKWYRLKVKEAKIDQTNLIKQLDS